MGIWKHLALDHRAIQLWTHVLKFLCSKQFIFPETYVLMTQYSQGPVFCRTCAPWALCSHYPISSRFYISIILRPYGNGLRALCSEDTIFPEPQGPTFPWFYVPQEPTFLWSNDFRVLCSKDPIFFCPNALRTLCFQNSMFQGTPEPYVYNAQLPEASIPKALHFQGSMFLGDNSLAQFSKDPVLQGPHVPIPD